MLKRKDIDFVTQGAYKVFSIEQKAPPRSFTPSPDSDDELP